MIKIIKLRSIFLVALLSLTGVVQLHSEQLPEDPAVRKGKLDNGLTYYIRFNDLTPGQADFYLANKVGSILETPQQRGLAHFLEHMAFNGTVHFPDGNGGGNSVRGWCEKNGIKFGADLNAYTSTEETVYNISNAPVKKAGVADTCLLILRDWAGSLLLKDDEIDAERGVIKEEWRARRSRFATTRMMEDAFPVIYKDSKYADCLPIGNMEVIQTFDPKVLKDYYLDWYRPDLQGVIVVGDIDVDKMESDIKSLFSDLKVPENAPERLEFSVPVNKEMIVYTQTDEEQPTVNLSLYMKRGENKLTKGSREAYKEAYLSRLAMFILRQRLTELTHEAEPRLMSASVRDNGFYISPSVEAFSLTLGLMPDDPFKGIAAAVETVEKARRYGVSDAELEHAKIQHAVNIEHKRDMKEKTRNSEYVNALLRNFLDDYPYMDIDTEADLQAELNEEISVEDINKTLAEVITDEQQVLIVFGPALYNGQPYRLPDKELLVASLESAQKADYPDNAKGEETDTEFIKELPVAGTIISKSDVGNGYTEYLLSNGIKVSVRPSDLEPNRLTLNMFRLGGKSLYPDEDAATLQFLNNVIKESGAADFDKLTLEKKRRGKALRVEPYISVEEEGVKGVCAASDFKTWLEVMYLYLTQPRKDEGVFSNMMTRQESMLRNRDANPNVSFNDSLKIAVYGDRKAVQPLTADRLKEVDLERIYEIYNERFSDLSGMNFIITGDVREEEFEELLCLYVASLPGNPDFDREFNVGQYTLDLRLGDYTNIFTKEMKTPSALTEVLFWAPIEYTAENDLLLSVLCQLLKMDYTDTMREEEGATYGVSVSGIFWKYPQEGCSLTVNFRCSPDSYEKLLPMVDSQIEKIASAGPSAESLEKIKEYETKNYERAVQTNGWWEYVRYSQLHDGVDFNKDYLQNVEKITPVVIREFCRKLLQGNNRIQVTMKAQEDSNPAI